MEFRRVLSDLVLLAGDQTVDGGELPGDTDRRAHRLRIGAQVVTTDAQVTGVRADEGREDLNGRGLAGAVRAAQRSDERRVGKAGVSVDLGGGGIPITKKEENNTEKR